VEILGLKAEEKQGQISTGLSYIESLGSIIECTKNLVKIFAIETMINYKYNAILP
jgi:hypothetical protein